MVAEEVEAPVFAAVRILWAICRRLFSSSASARAATEKIRIMSYNIPMGNILVTDGNGRNTWENRCAVIHQYLTDVAPDLLGMQEPVRQELCDILRGIPNYAMVGTARNDGAESGEYTPIIYRTDRFRITYFLNFSRLSLLSFLTPKSR